MCPKGEIRERGRYLADLPIRHQAISVQPKARWDYVKSYRALGFLVEHDPARKTGIHFFRIMLALPTSAI